MARVMIIGARRRRQGIGEFLAQAFAAAGADVAAIVGTSPETVGQAQARLRERYGIRCAAYTSVVAALEREAPDIVAICSPYDVHHDQLQAVQQAGAHCLCDKPLWWGATQDRVAATMRIVDGFIARRRYLALATQWPYTLPAFFSLYPQAKSQPVADFEMMLSPIRPGLNMILDAAPHPLSMLQELVGYGAVSAPRLRFLDPDQRDQRRLELDFEYWHGTGTTAVHFKTAVCAEAPRPASYAINGYRVEREIALPEYQVSFAGDGRRLRVEDPLQLLVADFLDKVKTNCAVDRRALIDSIGALEVLYSCGSNVPVAESEACASLGRPEQ